MSGADLFEDGYPHGTVPGYDGGCRGGACPAGVEFGLSCKQAKTLDAGDIRYARLVTAGYTPHQIAIELDLTTTPTTAPTPVRTQPAQPLAERSQDRMPAPTPTDAPSDSPTPVEPDEAGRREEMGHPEPTPEPEDTTVPLDPPQPLTTDQWTNGLSVAGKTAKLREIREWARHHGHDVPVKGKIPQAALAAYAAAETAGELPPPTPTPERSPEPTVELVDDAPDQAAPTPPAPVNIVPDPGDHPDWGQLQTDQALARLEKDYRRALAERNRARTTATRLWDENTALQTRIDELQHQLATSTTALNLALKKWATARFERDLLRIHARIHAAAADAVRRDHARDEIRRIIEHGDTLQALHARIAELETTRRPLFNWRRR